MKKIFKETENLNRNKTSFQNVKRLIEIIDKTLKYLQLVRNDLYSIYGKSMNITSSGINSFNDVQHAIREIYLGFYETEMHFYKLYKTNLITPFMFDQFWANQNIQFELNKVVESLVKNQRKLRLIKEFISVQK